MRRFARWFWQHNNPLRWALWHCGIECWRYDGEPVVKVWGIYFARGEPAHPVCEGCNDTGNDLEDSCCLCPLLCDAAAELAPDYVARRRSGELPARRRRHPRARLPKETP